VKRANKLNTANLVIRHPAYDEEICRQHPAWRICQPYPLMVEMSSVGDIPTGWVMPVANLVNWVPPVVFLAHPSARLFSAPFTPRLHTHKLASCGHGDDPCKVDEGAEFAFQMPASPMAPPNSPKPLWEQLDRVPHQPSPFVWDFTVDREVSRNHGDVWNGNVAAMIFALIDPRGQQTKYSSAVAGPPPAPVRRSLVTEAPPPTPATAANRRRPRMGK
jgi:hypothetical protein